jgi:hypothetical protein
VCRPIESASSLAHVLEYEIAFCIGPIHQVVRPPAVKQSAYRYSCGEASEPPDTLAENVSSDPCTTAVARRPASVSQTSSHLPVLIIACFSSPSRSSVNSGHRCSPPCANRQPSVTHDLTSLLLPVNCARMVAAGTDRVQVRVMIARGGAGFMPDRAPRQARTIARSGISPVSDSPYPASSLPQWPPSGHLWPSGPGASRQGELIHVNVRRLPAGYQRYLKQPGHQFP